MTVSLRKQVSQMRDSVNFLSSRQLGQTVIGFVSTKGELVSSMKRVCGEWVEVEEEAQAFFAEAMKPAFTRPKRFTVLIGGRGSGKSIGIGGMCSIEMHDEGNSWMCLREFQSSIADSVHSLLKSEVARLELDGFSSTDNAISAANGAKAKFAGIARNPSSIKSASGFNVFWGEESQSLSEDSIKMLSPTARNKPLKGLPKKMEEVGEDDALQSARLIFVANPGSSEDPFSKRFINPFKAELDANGIYEDHLHLIIKMNWSDNPWYHLSGLEEERFWDYENLPRALYDHIWEGEFNDSVEGALIMSEWFDACVDAHEKLGFKAKGAIFGAHDPSDTGGDSKGFAARHGSVVFCVEEKQDGDVNEGGDWATGLALRSNCTHYTWDCDGLGVGLSRQTSEALNGRVKTQMFKGSESPDFPLAVYESSKGVGEQKTNEDVFRNKRAQYYTELRDRCYRTFRAVVHGEYQDPEKMISFDSKIPSLKKLRAELCRMPVKPNANGFIELYTKPEMKSKFKFKSPNLADSVMMLMRNNVTIESNDHYIPRPITPRGRR